MPTTFQEVGASIGLSGAVLSRYTAYMLVRWAHRERELCSTHYSEYATVWAKRFKEGLEYQESDCEGIAVLQNRASMEEKMIKPKSALWKRKAEIDLTGPDGNAFVLLGYAQRLAKQLGKDGQTIVAEMKEGDYEHLLKVFDREFGKFVTLYR